MTKRKTDDFETRCDDLTDAMKAIGRIVADSSVTPKQRIAQVTGVLRIYECEAPTATPVLPLEAPRTVLSALPPDVSTQ